MENEIRTFKANKLELESKGNLLNQQINKFSSDLSKLNFEKEAFYNEKNTFFKVNFMLSNGKIWKI